MSFSSANPLTAKRIMQKVGRGLICMFAKKDEAAKIISVANERSFNLISLWHRSNHRAIAGEKNGAMKLQ